jgi:hypothetical protein
MTLGKIMNLVARLAQIFGTRKPLVRSIRYDSAGFTVLFDGVPSAVMKWQQVREIVVFKEDLFAHDSICFGFRRDESGIYESVGEHVVDFDAFSKEVIAHFPGFRTDWPEAVVQPPFAEKWTVVWTAVR